MIPPLFATMRKVAIALPTTSTARHGVLVTCGALAIAVVIGTACSGSDKSAAPTPGERTGTPVAVGEKEWSVAPSLTAVKAGEVRFTVKNSGTTAHELIVAKSDAELSKLPTYAASDKPAEGHAEGDVDEDKVSAVGELDDIAPGTTKDATFTLSAGKYILYCNLPAHYAQGMRVGFTVQ